MIDLVMPIGIDPFLKFSHPLLLAAMPATDYRGVIGETSFTPQGDLKHGAISVFTYRSGRKALLDIVRM